MYYLYRLFDAANVESAYQLECNFVSCLLTIDCSIWKLTDCR